VPRVSDLDGMDGLRAGGARESGQWDRVTRKDGAKSENRHRRAGKAPRSLWGFPQWLRRLQSLGWRRRSDFHPQRESPSLATAPGWDFVHSGWNQEQTFSYIRGYEPAGEAVPGGGTVSVFRVALPLRHTASAVSSRPCSTAISSAFLPNSSCGCFSVHRRLGARAHRPVASSPRATPCPARRPWRGASSFPESVGNGSRTEGRRRAIRIFSGSRWSSRAPEARHPALPDARAREPSELTTAAGTRRPSRAPTL
jgi:hypothetical protein